MVDRTKRRSARTALMVGNASERSTPLSSGFLLGSFYHPCPLLSRRGTSTGPPRRLFLTPPRPLLVG